MLFFYHTHFYLQALIPFGVFLYICWILCGRRFSKPAFWLWQGGTLAGVLLLQAFLILSGQDDMLILNLLPITAYLPMIVSLHFCSSASFFQTCPVWMIGALSAFSLRFFRKFLELQYGGSQWMITGVLFAAAVLLGGLVFVFLRRPFQDFAKGRTGAWFPFVFPMIMVFVLFSYFGNSTASSILLILILLTALSMLLVLSRQIVLQVSVQKSRQMECQVKKQLESQRKEYETIQEKMAQGRIYRHDMRHHLAVLEGLLNQNDGEEAKRYIQSLVGKLNGLEAEIWCQNTAVNAALSYYIGHAREQGCHVLAEANIPAEISFDEADICMIFSNALENAVLACQAVPEPKRRIQLHADYNVRERLVLSMSNPCEKPVKIGEDGFPVTPPRKGHGIGLRSIEAMTKKYNGLFQCQSEGGQFILKVVLFGEAAKEETERTERHVKETPAKRVLFGLGALFLGFFVLNCMPSVTGLMEQIPVLGGVIQAADLRTYGFTWGSTEISWPDPGGANQENEEWNALAEEFLDQMQEEFLRAVMRKYDGYVGMDSDYTVVRDDEILCVTHFYATVNMGGSADYSRYIVLDKQRGQVLWLSDLFRPDSDYIDVVSREILRQMEEQVEAGTGRYYISGQGWLEEDCFHTVDSNQNFYIDETGSLVIVFDEYQVAPGSMGMPEFVIPTKILDGLLAEPSLLR